MKTFVAAGGLAAAALALTAGPAQAGGHVNWSIGINLPLVGALISNGLPYRVDAAPVYSSGYGPQYAPAYGAAWVPAPVYAPPLVVYRAAPPVFYPRPLAYGGYVPPPIAYGVPAGRWHDGRGWRDGRADGRDPRGDSRDGRWAPVPRDERRGRH